MRHAFPMSLPENVHELAAAFKAAGFELFVVGGAVRDAILGTVPKDFDLATNAMPDQVCEILVNMVCKTDEVGKSFGVVRARFQKLDELFEYEIATFRQDVGTGRRPDSVVFTTIEEDVKRRDLTINALFYDIATREIVDLVGGVQDIMQGVIRTVGNPYDRFTEDRLRVLRAIRFSAKFGYDLDEQTLAAIVHDNNLYGVSPERVRDEFVKAVNTSRNLSKLIEQLETLQMFEHMLPGLKVTTKYDSLVSTRGVAVRNVVILLAILLEENPIELVTKRLNELKYSDTEIKQITFFMRLKNLSIESAFKLRKAFVNLGLPIVTLSEYSCERGLPDRFMMGPFISYVLTSTPISGNLLMAQGYSGRELGMELERREIELFRGLLNVA